jgi:hypothetical protein
MQIKMRVERDTPAPSGLAQNKPREANISMANIPATETDEAPPDSLRGPLADFIRSLPGPLRPSDLILSEVIDQAHAARTARVGGEWAEAQELASP